MAKRLAQLAFWLAAIVVLPALGQSGHVEQGKITIPKSGRVVVTFKSDFGATMPRCVTEHREELFAFSHQWVEFRGKPGTVVFWRCE